MVGIHDVPGAEFHFNAVAVLAVPDINYRSFFIAEHLGQKSSPPDMIAYLHIDPFSASISHNAQPNSTFGS